MARKKRPSREKAKEILRHGEVRGHPLTRKQKGLFGLIAGGGRPRSDRSNAKRIERDVHRRRKRGR